jgi:hypothetical protein
VHELFELPDTDGLWLAARCTVTSPPAWLKRGTRASFGFVRRSEQEIPGRCRVQCGYVTEVSVLRPGVEPAEPRAQVSLLTSSPAAASTTSDRGVAVGDVVIHDRSDAEIERLIAAEEARRGRASSTRPGLLVRPGVGQVLGFR